MTTSWAAIGRLVVLSAVVLAPLAAGAFDRDAWTGGRQDDGTFQLRCARPGCTADTFMTFRLRPAHAVADAAAYDRLIAGAIPELRKRGIAAATTAAVRSTIGRFTLYRATRTLTYPDGHRQYCIAGMLVGDDLSISLQAAAPRRRARRPQLRRPRRLARPPSAEGESRGLNRTPRFRHNTRRACRSIIRRSR